MIIHSSWLLPQGSQRICIKGKKISKQYYCSLSKIVIPLSIRNDLTRKFLLHWLKIEKN